MKYTTLHLALAAACLSATAHASIVSPASPVEPSWLPVSGIPTAILTPEGLPRPETERDASPLLSVMWVRRADLEHPPTLQRVANLFKQGHAILVTGKEAATDVEVDIFGYRATGSTAIYHRGTAGALDVASVEDGASPAQAIAWVQQWVMTKMRPRPVPYRADSLAAAPAPRPDYEPRIEIHEDMGGRTDGRGVRHNIIVLRDVNAGRDEKVIIVTSEVDQKPSFTGTLYGTLDGNVDDYESVEAARASLRKRDGDGFELWLADRYFVTLQAAGVGESVPITLEQYLPTASDVVSRAVNTTSIVKTSQAVAAGFARESVNATQAVPDPSAIWKLPVTYTGSREQSEQTSLSMTLDDYVIESSSQKNDQYSAVNWVFPLAADIAGNRRYFQVGDKNSTTKFTPMNRGGTLKTSAVWRIPGAYEGSIDITTQSSVLTRHLNAYQGAVRILNDPASSFRFNSRLRMDSHRLTRQPTVRLQSKWGTGACLTQDDAERDEVTMAACRGGTATKAQQWTLELDATYRNRSSGRCLTADPHDGRVHVAPCDGAPLNQQWHWSRDRLASPFSVGGTWRLHMRDGAVHAKPDPTIHSTVVVNIYNPLLPPWSSYPEKPELKDTVPMANRTGSPIPLHYLTFGPVGFKERWQPQLVREGL